jgi:hypothetical protein
MLDIFIDTGLIRVILYVKAQLPPLMDSWTSVIFDGSYKITGISTDSSSETSDRSMVEPSKSKNSLEFLDECYMYWRPWLESMREQPRTTAMALSV